MTIDINLTPTALEFRVSKDRVQGLHIGEDILAVELAPAAPSPSTPPRSPGHDVDLALDDFDRDVDTLLRELAAC